MLRRCKLMKGCAVLASTPPQRTWAPGGRGGTGGWSSVAQAGGPSAETGADAADPRLTSAMARRPGLRSSGGGGLRRERGCRRAGCAPVPERSRRGPSSPSQQLGVRSGLLPPAEGQRHLIRPERLCLRPFPAHPPARSPQHTHHWAPGARGGTRRPPGSPLMRNGSWSTSPPHGRGAVRDVRAGIDPSLRPQPRGAPAGGSITGDRSRSRTDSPRPVEMHFSLRPGCQPAGHRPPRRSRGLARGSGLARSGGRGARFIRQLVVVGATPSVDARGGREEVGWCGRALAGTGLYLPALPPPGLYLQFGLGRQPFSSVGVHRCSWVRWPLPAA